MAPEDGGGRAGRENAQETPTARERSCKVQELNPDLCRGMGQFPGAQLLLLQTKFAIFAGGS